MLRRPTVLAFLGCLLLTVSPRDGRVIRIGDLTWPEIDALDRDRSVFLLSVGMLEEHGPHLPIASDGIGVEYEAEHVAARLGRALPGWNVVLMPTAHYGSTGANQVGRMPVHPGTYGIRTSTLRSLVADIGAQIAQNRFRWIFVMSGHAAPPHAIAINEACDFVADEFGVTMLNVSALFMADSATSAKGARIAARHFSRAELDSFGIDVHAGVSETSGLLAIRPDLVRPRYRELPGRRAGSLLELRAVALRPGWEGYFSSPARASARYGRDIEAWWIEGMSDLILQSVRGSELSGRPRYPGNLDGDPRAPVVDEVRAQEREFEQRFERWLERQSAASRVREPRVELDHAYIVVEPGGAAGIEALRSAGLTIAAEPRRHEGQGTASVAAMFENAYLELIWVDSTVPVDADHRATFEWFQRASAWRSNGRSPFGLGTRRLPGDTAGLPVPVRREPAQWLPEGSAYELLLQPEDSLTADLFVVPAATAVPTWIARAMKRIPAEFRHPRGDRTISLVRVHGPRGNEPSAFRVLEPGGIEMVPGPAPLLEVHLDGSEQESRTDLRPALPLVIVRGGPPR
jgi:creatinine amidohydrolase